MASPSMANHREQGGVDPAGLQAYCVMSGRDPARVATHDPPLVEAGHQEKIDRKG